MIKRGEKLEVPFLNINTPDNTDTITVVGHKGRHRARAMKQLGYNEIPVLIQADTLRWSEQTDINNFDYHKIWYKYIISQNGSKKLPFPISREQSDKDF